MKRIFVMLVITAAFSVGGYAQNGTKPATADTAKPKKANPVADKVKSSKKIDGLFTIYQDTATGSVQLFIKKNQLGKEYIYQSFSISGPTSLFLNQNMIRATWVFKIKKAFDKIEFSQVNTSFWYDKNNAVSKAANVDVPEAVFYSDKVGAEDSTGYLINADGLFISEKLDQVKPLFPPGLPPGAVFNLGGLNTAKSKYSNIRSFPNNTDVTVDLAYDNPAPFNGGGKDITDARYVRVRMQHSFIEMPSNDFRPRRDDPRVGYFTQEIDNLTTVKPVNFKDIINRWYLKKKDPTAAISEPVEPIVYWIENTTPVEYRQTIKEAGEKWNEAFEKAGFKNAVVMKIMPDDADWDPADIRYNVIRWVSSAYPQYGAIGPSFVNPNTGQILGADITVEWFSGSSRPNDDELYNGYTKIGEVEADPITQFLTPAQRSHWATCTMAKELKAQFTAGLTAAEIAGADEKEIGELHKEFLYYLIMHEMGHTLGLNHNMKASQMLSPSEVNNKSITHSLGLQGSVMDYPAINVSLDRSKQGDYYTTKAGPYDIWAIEYGYTPFSEDEEEAGLNKILARSTDPKLAFGNDADDMRSIGSGIDPRVNVNDMSNDMVAYAEDRFKLVNNLMGKLKAKYTKQGQSYQELRARYGTLNGQRASMAYAVSRYIGGVYVDRSFPEQNSTNKPFTPVPVTYQKKAMEFLSKNLFAPNAFDADAQVFPYLQLQRRGYNFFGSTEDPKPQNTVMALQMNVLAALLNPVTAQRYSTSSLYGNTYSVADVMNDLVKAIFDADKTGSVNLYRQNLQTEFVKGVAGIATEGKGYDNPTKAAALNTLKKVKTLLATAVSPNEQTKAHRAQLSFIIEKALAVK
ncbi:MAG: zinc-dependent metalloprotease [Sphingobacteriales bacterium]|nr:zinc-dependent metalloprotease [Sphingobacteriales bacterium]MBI3719966.1 zinc-dependent metalloprotease [Sphingobacteriales bacterium]